MFEKKRTLQKMWWWLLWINVSFQRENWKGIVNKEKQRYIIDGRKQFEPRYC